MRHLRLTIGVALCACALVAFTGAASASEFVVEQQGVAQSSLTTKGGSGTEGHQEFNFGGFQIRCQKGVSAGSVAPSALFDETKFAGCTTADHFGDEQVNLPTVFKNPLEVIFSPDGTGSIRGTTLIEIKPLKCTIRVSAGEGGLEAVAFTQEKASTGRLHVFPSGFQHKLLIESNLEGLEYAFEGKCPAGGATDGSYAGVLRDEAPKGDIGFETTEGINTEWNQIENVKD